MDKRKWNVELTPARPVARRGPTPGADYSAETAQYDHVLEAIEKLTDIVRRVEAKVDAMDERITALSRPPRIQRPRSDIEPDGVGAEVRKVRRRLERAATPPADVPPSV